MKRTAIIALIAATVALDAGAQPAQDANSATQVVAITGRVVADDTGAAIPNARVSLTTTAPALGTPVVLTDADGRFALAAPSGRRSVIASKSGYATGEVASAGEQAIEIRLRRGAAISGRVVDEFGDPVPGTRVVAQTVSGSSTPTVATVAAADTDDRGEYRLAMLPAGTFAVAALTIPGPTIIVEGTTPVPARPSLNSFYYPGVSTPTEAEGVRLQAGESRPGVDIVVPAERAVPPLVVMMRMKQAEVTGAPAPTPAMRGTAVVRGRVVGTDGRPVPHAVVRLTPQLDIMQSRAGRADNIGRFEFTDLAAGIFRVAAVKQGYASVGMDQPAAAGVPALTSDRQVEIADGQAREGVDLGLARWRALEGHVLDELGDPLQGASVHVLQVRYEAGRRRLVRAGGGARTTDDLGRYRLYGLMPGQYIVSATIGGASSMDVPGYARSYFPGTPNPGEARFLSMNASQDVSGIDFSLSRTRTARVAGKMLNAAGEPTSPGSLWLLPSQRSTAVTSVPLGARILDGGTFEFPNVPAGQYVIKADRGRSNSWTEGEFGTLPVSVNGADVTDLTLQTSSGSSIKGRFTLDTYDNSKIPAASKIELSPMPVDFDLSPSNPATAEIQADWSFEIAGVNGPRRLELLRAPAGWALKEIRVKGIPVTDRPLAFGKKDQSLTGVEVVLTDRVNEVTATIKDDRDRPAPNSILIVFSTDRDRWYPASRFLRKGVAGPEGAVTVAGLPFGSYYAATVARVPIEGEDGWQDVEFLASLAPRASTVTLGDGQKLLLNLRLPAR